MAMTGFPYLSTVLDNIFIVSGDGDDRRRLVVFLENNDNVPMMHAVKCMVELLEWIYRSLDNIHDEDEIVNKMVLTRLCEPLATFDWTSLETLNDDFNGAVASFTVNMSAHALFGGLTYTPRMIMDIFTATNQKTVRFTCCFLIYIFGLPPPRRTWRLYVMNGSPWFFL